MLAFMARECAKHIGPLRDSDGVYNNLRQSYNCGGE